MDHKLHVNKKQNVEIDISTACGGEGEYMQYISFLWPPFEAALSILNVSHFYLHVFTVQ